MRVCIDIYLCKHSPGVRRPWLSGVRVGSLALQVRSLCWVISPLIITWFSVGLVSWGPLMDDVESYNSHTRGRNSHTWSTRESLISPTASPSITLPRLWKVIFKTHTPCIFPFYFLLEDNYNIVLVFSIHQHESAISICMYPPFWISHLPAHPTPIGCHRAPD